ncbi:MAG: hypothetical protein MR763_00400, partial [Clostridiales bacterium]|nr:hypothetical protein [Clostridiales bacterium]
SQFSPAVVGVCIFNEKVIHSPNELKKAEPFQLGRDSAFFLRDYLTAPSVFQVSAALTMT